MTKNVLDEKTPPKIEEIKIEEDFHAKYERERKEKERCCAVSMLPLMLPFALLPQCCQFYHHSAVP